MMKKLNYCCLVLLLLSSTMKGQQLPYYTQFRSNDLLQNPAVSGTKRTIDARLNYRMQWLGFEGAPRTESFSLNSRFYKGRMGAGVYMMQDKVGPAKQMNLGASYAIHFRFPDCELSAGVGGNYTNYTLLGSLITLHHTQDPSIDQNVSSSVWVGDANAGIYLYNDRFHLGASAMHLLQSTAAFYKSDSIKRGKVKYATQANVSVGYNFGQNPSYIWESNLFANYVTGLPIMLDYTLRLHVKEKFMTGISLRLHDAVAIHFGISFLENFQASYSYDLLISNLRPYSSGSHEIMLVYNMKYHSGKHGFLDTQFLHQKYGYML